MKIITIVGDVYKIKNKDFEKLKKLLENIDNSSETTYSFARIKFNEQLNKITDNYKPFLVIDGDFRQD